MAREEHEREDLLREATALVERAEWQVDGFAETVVAGFRRDGAASFFFTHDLVYQFNSAAELRRGYAGGKLIKAEGGALASLTRIRTGGEVQLQRHDFQAGELQRYLADLENHLLRLESCLAAGAYTTVGQVPADVDVAARVLAWLQQRGRPAAIAGRPGL